MPKMNGEETFHALRQISPDVRVILSSGYSEEAATDAILPVGLAGFIQKPYQFDTMIAKLRGAGSGLASRKAQSSAIVRVRGWPRFPQRANPRRGNHCLEPYWSLRTMKLNRG